MASSCPKTILFLFDIDGTLMTSGGAGEHALRLAVRDRFGGGADGADELEGIEIAGRTDRGIVERLFRKFGAEPDAAEVERFLESYLAHLATELPLRQGRLLPGIPELLEALRARPEAALALLTGNLARGARLKLLHYGVWSYFEFGAYADDHADRNHLGPVARARARERHGVEFPPERIFVLGDTEHDIACGRAIGARTVAVATGSTPRETLARHQPDFLFDDLSDVARVLGLLLP